MIRGPDIIIIGSGIGGASAAAGLASSGANILILEAGHHLADGPENVDQGKIFREGYFRPREIWFDGDRHPFNPGNYYYVGGNSKFYGAVLARYRYEDFAEMHHQEGISPAWPFNYDELEPWYCVAEKLYGVRGQTGLDPSEPPHSKAYDYGAVPDEAPIAELRSRLFAQGYHPYSLPLGIDINRWRERRNTPWDAHRHADDGKMDAETAALREALKHPNVTLLTGARVTRLEAATQKGKITSVVYEKDGLEQSLAPKIATLAAGAVQSAILLLRSGDSSYSAGIANSSDQVGRNFMNHNCSAVLGFSPWFRNDDIYQKAIGLNDFYLSDGDDGPPLGNIQLLGKVSGTILKSSLPKMPLSLFNAFSRHTVDWYAMSEDLPDPGNRVTWESGKVVLKWKRNNWQAHLRLVSKLKSMLRRCGFPIVFSRAFDKRTPFHQCGTIRIGNDPAVAPLDVHCRSYDYANLFVCDASCLPTSAAVNPALTVAALALRTANHIIEKELQ
jgi:choline dehydrogenase-like flavoprotein